MTRLVRGPGQGARRRPARELRASAPAARSSTTPTPRHVRRAARRRAPRRQAPARAVRTRAAPARTARAPASSAELARSGPSAVPGATRCSQRVPRVLDSERRVTNGSVRTRPKRSARSRPPSSPRSRARRSGRCHARPSRRSRTGSSAPRQAHRDDRPARADGVERGGDRGRAAGAQHRDVVGPSSPRRAPRENGVEHPSDTAARNQPVLARSMIGTSPRRRARAHCAASSPIGPAPTTSTCWPATTAAHGVQRDRASARPRPRRAPRTAPSARTPPGRPAGKPSRRPCGRCRSRCAARTGAAARAAAHAHAAADRDLPDDLVARREAGHARADVHHRRRPLVPGTIGYRRSPCGSTPASPRRSRRRCRRSRPRTARSAAARAGDRIGALDQLEPFVAVKFDRAHDLRIEQPSKELRTA